MENTIEISGYKCVINGTGSEECATYMIYPEIAGMPEKWLKETASKYGVALIMVYVPASQWNDALTPWPEPGEAPGCQPFAGKAADFLKLLQESIIPQAEKSLALKPYVPRDLVGVSLSGLFTFWQWMQCDTFRSIACLSGSFWYLGFMEWFDNRPVPHKEGKAYFLLGKEEPHSSVKTFRSVGENTEAIAERLKESGVDVAFEWVPGNHFSAPLARAQKAFDHLYT